MGGRKSQGIFVDTTQIIEETLRLKAGESIRHKRVALGLRGPPSGFGGFTQMIRDVYGSVESRRTGRPVSRENWRSERQLRLHPDNRSPEVLLERSIARLSEYGLLREWYNQVPVASGFVNTRDDKRAAVDLVRWSGGELWLVELKWESDTPLFAAFEILRYGVAFLYAWVNRPELGYGEKELLSATRVSLRVLAPMKFYEEYELGWLRSELSEGIGAVALEQSRGRLSMDFAFDSFPPDFRLPVESGAAVADLSRDGEPARRIKRALKEVRPVWPAPRTSLPRVGRPSKMAVLRGILDQFMASQEYPRLRKDRSSYVTAPGRNLVGGLEEAVLEDFSSGAGGELEGALPKFCAVHSSSALAANVFGKMRLHPGSFQLAGIGRFEKARFEQKLPTGLMGTPPHLDFFASGPAGSVAVESKFTEFLGSKTAAFAPSYREAVARLADEPWRRAFESLVADPSHFRRLDAAQLVKHYLGIRHSLSDTPGDLVLLYVYWEPQNPGLVEDFRIHRDELSEFSEWVAGSGVRFVTMTYQGLWDEWGESCTWPGIRRHLAELRKRYEVWLPT